jgi:hypothetical protein
MDHQKAKYTLLASIVMVVALPLLLFQGQILAIISMVKTINTPVPRVYSAFQMSTTISCPPSTSLETTSTTFVGELDLDHPDSPGSQAWAGKLLTPKGGFLWVKYNETLDVTWAITMFHGLHCLEVIRSRLLDTSSGPKLFASQNSSVSDHAVHCLDYLAQVRAISKAWTKRLPAKSMF